jgi:hypothetical protein
VYRQPMLPSAAQLASFLLLLPFAAVPDPSQQGSRSEVELVAADELGAGEWELGGIGDSSLDQMIEAFRDRVANQVRIQQTFRIIVRPASNASPFMPLPPRKQRRAAKPRYLEVKIGKCVPTTNFAGMSTGNGRNITLYTRDGRVFSAQLERSCQARDLYSGFYLTRSPDGKLCVNRDSLQARTGANCKIKQIRELIESDD